MLAPCGFQGMANETGEAFPFHYGSEMHAEMSTAGQGSIGGPGQELS